MIASLVAALCVALALVDPSPPTWTEPTGWSREITAVGFAGGLLGSNRRAAVGMSMAYGFRYTRPVTPIAPGRGALRRAFGRSWLGNQFGLDLVATTLLSDRLLRAGPSLDLVARGVILDRDRDSTRVRVPAMLGFLVPDPGVVFEPSGRPWLHLRFNAPVSILVRDHVGVDLHTTTGVLALGGPTNTYVTFGVGVVLRDG